MRRAPRVVAAWLVAAASLTACSLLVETSDLSGGPDPRADGSLVESGGDSRSGEGGPATGDAGVDTSTPGDAAAKCVEGGGRFCDDFDQVNPGAKWADQSLRRGLLTYDDGSLSPPHALHATIQAGSAEGEAALIERYPSGPSQMRCDLDVKLEVIPTAGEVDVLDFITVKPNENHHVYFAVFEGTWTVAEFQPLPDGGVRIDRQKPLGIGLPLGTWFHVTFDTSLTTATLTANGATVTMTDLITPSGLARAIAAGIPFASNVVQAGSVFIDNVDCVTQP